MDDESKLNQFRQQWKQELSSNSTSKKHKQSEDESSKMLANVCESSSVIPQNKLRNTEDSVTGSSVGDTKKLDTLTTFPGTIPYGPFSIVGDLLNTKSEPNSLVPLQGNNIDRTSSYSQNAAKKRKDKVGKGALKKLKYSLKDIFCERQPGAMPEERLLDRLIADIDEITEIPFFDISIPREVAVKIFQHLSIRDLCQCAQVSAGWRSISEDELLWCRVCHRLGQETIYTTKEKTNWKQIVRHNVERQKLLVTNWKGRVGKLSQLDHAKGKILCVVDSTNDVVVAGYTNGDVKLWDLISGDSCVYQPSSTSLVVGNVDDDLRQNIVDKLVTSSNITAASYTQGNIDIWSLDSGTQPIQTYTPDTERLFSTPELCLSHDGATLSLNYGPFIEILHKDGDGGNFKRVHKLNNEIRVCAVKLYENGDRIPSVMFSSTNSVNLYQSAQPDLIGSESRMTEIHNMIGANVDIFDFKTAQSLLGVGVGSFCNEGYKIKLYDIKTTKLVSTLHGQTWLISCMNMAESPPNEVLTGSGDRKIHVFDIRSTTPVQTLMGHARNITCIQMDEWKVVSAAGDGFVCVWDRRMATKLWEWHNRHPVKYCHFSDKYLIVGNISTDKFPRTDEFDYVSHRSHRGSVNIYNFLEDLTTQDVPEICLSTYDQPEASRYNIGLAMPYDTLTF